MSKRRNVVVKHREELDGPLLVEVYDGEEIVVRIDEGCLVIQVVDGVEVKQVHEHEHRHAHQADFEHGHPTMVADGDPLMGGFGEEDPSASPFYQGAQPAASDIGMRDVTIPRIVRMDGYEKGWWVNLRSHWYDTDEKVPNGDGTFSPVTPA